MPISAFYHNINISIKYALLAQHDNNWYEVKSTNEYAVWIIQSGSLTIEYKQNSYNLSIGDVFLFYPQVLYHATSTNSCSFIFIHFDAIIGNNYQALHFYPFDGYYYYHKVKDHLDSVVSSAISLQKKNLSQN